MVMLTSMMILDEHNGLNGHQPKPFLRLFCQKNDNRGMSQEFPESTPLQLL